MTMDAIRQALLVVCVLGAAVAGVEMFAYSRRGQAVRAARCFNAAAILAAVALVLWAVGWVS